MLAASGILGLFTAGLVQLALAPHSLANMVTAALITVPNADLECPSLACMTKLTALAAHQPTSFTNSIAKLHNLLHLCITDAICDTSHMRKSQLSSCLVLTAPYIMSYCLAPPAW